MSKGCAPRQDKLEPYINEILVGKTIGGIRFGPDLQLLIGELQLEGQAYLNLWSKWQIYDGRPARFPNDASDIPERSVDEQLKELCSIRELTIIDAKVGGEYRPHLTLELEGNKFFFLNGWDEHHEPWEFGIYGNSARMLQVIALPGGDVGVTDAELPERRTGQDELAELHNECTLSKAFD